jgi:hypothetical protein
MSQREWLNSQLTGGPQIIRAELFDKNMAVAFGVYVKASAPILELCRQLLARGADPASPLEAWRGSILSLRVRTIGAAAALEVRPSGTGTPVFVRRKNRRRLATRVVSKRAGLRQT